MSTQTAFDRDTCVFARQAALGAAHEQVIFCQDERSGLRAIIGIHHTGLGPALGGTRFYPYRSERAALTDALRLSEGMTYKAAAAGLPLGGGKCVIIGDPQVDAKESGRTTAEAADALVRRRLAQAAR